MNLKPLITATLGIALILFIPELARSEGGKTYKITITNLTAGQPFTPSVLLTHSSESGAARCATIALVHASDSDEFERGRQVTTDAGLMDIICGIAREHILGVRVTRHGETPGHGQRIDLRQVCGVFWFSG